tara:strand:+ start:271 stop:558 length:288 start_codon:yes stop_codon:yes gene_type:complete
MKTIKNMKNLLSELSPENWKKYANAVADGATHARFTYADGSFHPYPIEKINHGMNAHRLSSLGLVLVKVTKEGTETLARLTFWNSFVDDREINPH